MAFMKIGARSWRSPMSISCNCGAWIPVGTPVGWMVLTRIDCAAGSLASARLRPTTPCLLAVYGVCSGVPLMPAAELTLTMLPPPRCSRWGMAASAGVPGADEVGVEHDPPVLVGRGVPCPGGQDSGVGDRSVEAAELFDADADDVL